MIYGDFNKFIKGVDLANNIIKNNTFDNIEPSHMSSTKNMYQEKDNDDKKFDYLISEINNAFKSNENIETPKPRPCISHENYVKMSIDKKNNELQSVLEKYENKDTKNIKSEQKNITKDDFIYELEENSKIFKKYLEELLDDNVELLSAINKIFDIVILNKDV